MGQEIWYAVQLSYTMHTQFGTLAFMPGDIIYIQLLSKPFLIVSSVQAAQDLMEKRAVKYSDRPYFLLLCEL